MWFKDKTSDTWSAAIRHLRKVDKDLAKTIDRVGPCKLAPRKDYFNLLCISIFNQQVSMAAAKSMYAKFCGQFPRKRPTPAAVIPFLAGDEELIRSCGISRQKRGYLKDLAEHFASGKIPVRRFAKMTDEEIIESLTAVKGIGRWTAEMFLIFVLNRPDVWPVDDLGVQEGYRQLKKQKARLTPKQLLPKGEIYRPYRTVATWYIWRGIEKPVRAKSS